MKKILITDGFEKEGIEKLIQEGFSVNNVRLSPEELIVQIPQYDALIVRSATKVTKEVIEKGACGNLKIVGRAGVGTDNIDKKAATENNILAVNAPNGPTRAVAELAFGLMINLARNIPNVSNELKNGKWNKSNGSELCEKTLGIISCGRIGSAVAQIAHGYHMDVIGYDPFPRENPDIKYVKLEELLEKSDFISIHSPKLPNPIIGSCELGAMKKTAYLIDLSRGGNVDEELLYNALKNKVIAGAAKDVFVREGKKFEEDFQSGKKNPLFELNNFYGTAHLGASTKEGQVKTAFEIVDVFSSYFKKGEIKNCINLGKKTEEYKKTYNISVIHQNVPGAFASVTSILGKEGINIVDMKAEYLENGKGYTTFRAEKPISNELIEKIKSLDTVYSVKK